MPLPAIQRYNVTQTVVTSLDPLDDLTGWIRGLRSSGYTKDILTDTHGIHDRDELQQSTTLVCSYADHAVSLLEQGFSGPPGVSFLPIYYALLNLAKICIVASDRRTTLLRSHNRRHGVGYEIKNSHSILTETIILRGNGVIPRFYETVTGETWPIKPHETRKMRMRRYYGYLNHVSHEYMRSFKKPRKLIPCKVRLEFKENKGFRLRVSLAFLPSEGRRKLRLLNGLRRIDGDDFVTTYVDEEPPKAYRELVNDFPRHLLYWVGSGNSVHTMTPVKNQEVHLVEELPILLSFFHLGSVVRYNPQFLTKLTRSEAWGFMLSLRKHCTMRFLVLFWSYLNRELYGLTPPAGEGALEVGLG